jgi:hypothetical protein
MKKIALLALVASVFGTAVLAACENKPANDPSSAAGSAMPEGSAAPAASDAPAAPAN